MSKATNEQRNDQQWIKEQKIRKASNWSKEQRLRNEYHKKQLSKVLKEKKQRQERIRNSKRDWKRSEENKAYKYS